LVKLYTFFVSHFSEKARWALDCERIPYEEKVLVPGPHQLLTRRVAGRSEVPLLEHDGKYVQGSGAILDYIADSLGGTRLSPAHPRERAKAVELEKRLDKVFGRGVQQVFYSVLLKDRRTLVALWSAGGPRWAPAFFALAFPAVAKAVKRMYKTGDAEVSRGRSNVSPRRSTSSMRCLRRRRTSAETSRIASTSPSRRCSRR
jgi:glutathione S-transferase